MSTAIERVNGTPVADGPRFDPLALAEADAVRARTEAEIKARRIAAEAEAEAVRIKAEAEAEKQRIANERARMQLEEKQAAHAKKLAAEKAEQEEIERAADAARRQAEAVQAAAKAETEKQQESADSWRLAAKTFYAVCQIVALPVQLHAFWNPHAPWLAATPLVLEGGAWVVQRGTRAAVDERRPYWHYRLIAWCLAFLAAGINLGHGLSAFDVWTAIGTAFCSIAGPGVDDLHENGRIRKRDGKLTRAQRRAKRKAERQAAAEKAAAEQLARVEKEVAEKAAREAAEQLTTERAEKYPEEWAHALRLAAAVGEISVTEAVWERAWDDLHATKPGVTVDAIRTRNAAARRLVAARSEAPGNTPSKVTNAQRASQMPPAAGRPRRTPPAVRGVRRKGDTPKYVSAARKQAAITAKQAVDTQSH